MPEAQLPPAYPVPPTNPNPPRAQGTTLGDVGGAYATATLKKRNPYMPGWMTGAVPHALVMAGLGGAAGHYLLPWLAEKYAPNIRQDRLKSIAGIGGGLLGLLAATPNLYGTFQAARGHQINPRTNQIERGPWTEGFKGWYNGYENIPPKSQQTEVVRQHLRNGRQYREAQQSRLDVSQALDAWKGWLEKDSSFDFWNQDTIDPDAMTDSLVGAVYNGKMDPIAATQAITAAEEARRYGSDNTTPGDLAAAAANTIMRGGVGAGVGYGLGRVVGALGGAFGALSPVQQRSLGRSGALIGSIGNIIAGSNMFQEG